MSGSTDWRKRKAELEAFRNAKPKLPSPGHVTAEVQADRVRRAIYSGHVQGQVSREHRPGGVR